MKRFVALMIAFLFLFCGCAEPYEEVSKDESSLETSEGETSFEEPAIEEKTDVVISQGKNYTVTTEAAESYPDTYFSELTNGKTNTEIYSYSNGALAGYATQRQDIVIDLEKEYDTIHTFGISYYLDSNAGLSTLVRAAVEYSSDNKNWTKVGLLKQTGESQLGAVNTAEFKVDKHISARYIKFTVTGNGSWIFLEELSVIALTTKEKKPSYSQLVEETYDSLGTLSLPDDGNEIDKTLPKVCISEGADYTVDQNANKKFPDKNGNMLTDGNSGSIYESQTWVGFDGGKDINIKIDLGNTVDDIASVEIVSFAREEMNIYLPTAFSFKAVDEKGNSEELGIIYGGLDTVEGRHKFVFSLTKTVSARYVEITVHTVDSALHFIDEISVYAYREDVIDNFYPEVVIDTNVTEWETVSDEYENLVLKKYCQISINNILPKQYYEFNTNVNSLLMTDGKFSEGYDIHNGRYFKFCNGDKRKIIFDLEYLSAVDKFTIGFCHKEDWSVYAPDNVNVVVSDDGENWYSVGKMAVAETEKEGIRRGELILDRKVKARYVAFTFEVVVWAGVDEIQVFGTKNTEGAVSADNYENVYEAEVSNKRKEPSEDLLNGTEHLCLLYHANSHSGYTVEDLIPYVAYVDENNVIKDTMFDSFLFLHNTGTMPSGGKPHIDSVMSDWQWCIDDLFTQGENLYALEEAAGKVKDALGLDEDFKYNVTMTVYYPSTTMTNFGDVDGDGISEDFSVYENRIKAFRWYIDQIEARFAEADFKNIKLVGYYWWHEEIDRTDVDSKKMLNDLSDIVHSKGKDFFWIPWHCAPGFTDWTDYGFDIACMQPNYVFRSETPYSNLTGNEKLTEVYSMGFEMEIFEDCLVDELFFKKYMEYVTLGAETGYMTDTVNMYYQSYLVFKEAAYSDNIMGRTIYDTTYHYIKGDLKNVPDSLETMNFESEKNTIFKGKIDFDGEKLREVQVSALPEHGTVTINSDGTFYYFPEKDYVGEVTFSFIYNEYLSWSEPCEIVINVK